MKSKSLVIYALLFLILGNLFATFVDVIVKLLAADVSLYQYLFLRQTTVLLLMFPFWVKLPKLYRQPGSLKVHSFRAAMTNIGAPCAVVALIHLPLATANVIFYAAPIITLVLATVVFKETMTRRKAVVTCLGFCGVVIALRPEYLGFAGLLAFCTAFALAGYNISVKWLPQGSSTINTIFWSNLLSLPLIAVVALLNWQPVTQDLILLAVGSCLCLVAYQACCIVAFRMADAGTIAVAEYSGLVFASLLGWLIFNESIDHWTLLGICLIILPILWQSNVEFTKHQPHS